MQAQLEVPGFLYQDDRALFTKVVSRLPDGWTVVVRGTAPGEHDDGLGLKLTALWPGGITALRLKAKGKTPEEIALEILAHCERVRS